jgi:glycine cleavage system H protein
MIPHDILTLYSAKPQEYFLAALFLVLFVPFWRYVQGGARARAIAPRPVLRRLTGWFDVPASLHFHPGHTWARVEPEGLVALGIDEFGSKLVGPLAGIRLPAPGARLGQGEVGWTLLARDRSVDMLSPVDGVVVEVNPRAFEPDQPAAGSYDRWLVKVRPTRLGSNLRTLLTGEFARAWMAASADAVRMRLSPSLGLAIEDGGVPIDGLAPALDPEGWDEFARELFLTKGPC